ncbi:50S ribosomal protein L13 [Candidatus Hydrogenosomobacter endosymbioticus]|uniref:Large ribosomal subunit protein uL13 n=1 Tax=Candidatus Hydrogenosomobacter endosymbioticus TaxID=2558174 RepID=A0ABM7V852_9PROT|nr:50S ribosomal protein L13 [Candidatus Hydrogenosomobacter endosymbioticus]BDB95951.1 50S ribosomal protein L13 [Candidatus Hydrogenosomobacter endosymbioticus]
MKTFSLKAGDIRKDWCVIDASGLVLGRLAAIVSCRLRGKHKPTYCPHMDCGDNVIVINASKVFLSGNNKMVDKKFYWHTGFPGGIKERSMKDLLGGEFPERVIYKAVERMITRGPLGRKQMLGLKVYAGPEHKHEAQRPVALDVSSMNVKNCRRDSGV